MDNHSPSVTLATKKRLICCDCVIVTPQGQKKNTFSICVTQLCGGKRNATELFNEVATESIYGQRLGIDLDELRPFNDAKGQFDWNKSGLFVNQYSCRVHTHIHTHTLTLSHTSTRPYCAPSALFPL